jgi:glycosyltransferase involved in cell wall biosynthesis
MLFIGRLSKEKGIYELINAFFKLQNNSNNIRLVLLGPCEEKAVEEKLQEWTLSSNIDYLGPTEIPEKYLSVASLLCLPSYREGFGTVVIEAAAIQVPTLGTNINGLKDAVEDGVTGMLVPAEDSDALYEAMKLFIHDPDLAERMGNAAYKRCKKVFDSTVLSRLVSEQYQYLLSKKNLDS